MLVSCQPWMPARPPPGQLSRTGEKPDRAKMPTAYGAEFQSWVAQTKKLPVGVGAEIFSFPALERSFLEGIAPHHREHVNEYILENRALFRTGRLTVPQAKRRPEVRLTVDTPEDLRRAEFIVENTVGAWPTTEEAIGLCSRFA